MSAEKNNIEQDLTAGKAAKYLVLPGIVPRAKELFGSGFGFLAHLIALVYASVGLLPSQHPYTVSANIGRFGLRHVIVEASNRLIIRKENIDQIIIFFAMLLGITILFGQLILVIFSFVIQPAFAGFPGFESFFVTPNCAAGDLAGCNDLAFALMDEVFRIPNLFGADAAIPPLNNALHNMFEFYNIAILLVAVLIFIYYLVLVVGETAMTGTPFGRRFAHIWAPIRLVVALGLLVPLNYGLNSGQYIALFTAKWGSSFATNVWYVFNTSLTAATATPNPIGGPTGGRQGESGAHSLVTDASVPDLHPLMEFMSVALTCKEAYDQAYADDDAWAGNQVEMYWVFSGTNTGSGNAEDISAAAADGYDAAEDWFSDRGTHINIVIGHRADNDTHAQHPGSVIPYCGELTVNVASSTNEGARTIQAAYYAAVNSMWDSPELIALAQRVVAMSFVDDDEEACDVAIPGYTLGCNGGVPNPEAILPDGRWALQTVTDFNAALITAAENARGDLVDQLSASADEGFQIPDEMLELGWGGAGLWYNRIAEWNGAFVTAALHMPAPTKLPLVSIALQEELKADLENPDNCSLITPYKPDGNDVDQINAREVKIANVLFTIMSHWTCSEYTPDPARDVSGNIVNSVLDLLLGLGDLTDIRNAENRNIHPLAQLSGIGRSIIETAVRNLMFSLGFSAGGGISEILNETPFEQGNWSQFAKVATGFTTIGLTVGFILFYILPFMPFMYFFFAVGKWVKSVFEAMVGVPLWALAHLRVDGNGLPGETASNGYFLILEIFLRPVLCVFGLLASIAIFTALARTLNGIWDLVIVNAAGFGCHNAADGAAQDCVDVPKYRKPVDAFFFTVIYTIILYLMATGSFKLIDQIPSSILRWIGSGAQSFADTTKDDSAASLTRYAAIGGNTVGSQAVEAANMGARFGGQMFGLPLGLALKNARGGQTGVQGAGTPTPGANGAPD